VELQGRETLPVAVIDIERRKQIHETIEREITLSLQDETDMPESSRIELERERAQVRTTISRFTTELTVRLGETAA